LCTGRTAITGRMTWSARATCARALQVLALVKDFLTYPKKEQARITVEAARKAGFRTRDEMRNERKLKVQEAVETAPGSYTNQIRKRADCSSHACLNYLHELENKG